MSTSTIESSRSSRWKTFGFVFSALGLLMSLWSLASPLGSVPDEPAHMVRAAAVVRGDFAGVKDADIPSEIAVVVPRYVTHTHMLVCFAFHPEIAADCQPTLKTDPNELVLTPTSAGANSPVVYAIAGLPTLVLSGDVALYSMRIANALACSALLAFMFMFLRESGRAFWTTVAAGVAITPMVVYLGGSVNPNALELAAAGALFGTLVATFRSRTDTRNLVLRGAVAAVSVTLLANSRSIGLLWILVIVAVSLLFAHREVIHSLLRRPTTWITAGVGAIGIGFALWWYLRPTDLEAGRTFEGLGSSYRDALERMVDRTIDDTTGWIGFFGWVDRPAPALAYAAWAIAIGVLLLSALMYGSGRPRIAVIALSITLLLVPPLVQAALIGSLGFIWQGRYTIAIFVCLLVAVGIALDAALPADPSVRARRAIVMGILVLAWCHTLTFAWVLRRFAVGEGTWAEMLRAPRWEPPLSVLGICAIYTITVALIAWSLIRRLPAAPLGGRTDRDQVGE